MLTAVPRPFSYVCTRVHTHTTSPSSPFPQYLQIVVSKVNLAAALVEAGNPDILIESVAQTTTTVSITVKVTSSSSSKPIVLDTTDIVAAVAEAVGVEETELAITVENGETQTPSTPPTYDWEKCDRDPFVEGCPCYEDVDSVACDPSSSAAVGRDSSSATLLSVSVTVAAAALSIANK